MNKQVKAYRREIYSYPEWDDESGDFVMRYIPGNIEEYCTQLPTSRLESVRTFCLKVINKLRDKSTMTIWEERFFVSETKPKLLKF